MSKNELKETLEAFKNEHGIFALQDALIRALVESVTVEKAVFEGDRFKITIKNPKPTTRIT